MPGRATSVHSKHNAHTFTGHRYSDNSHLYCNSTLSAATKCNSEITVCPAVSHKCTLESSTLFTRHIQSCTNKAKRLVLSLEGLMHITAIHCTSSEIQQDIALAENLKFYLHTVDI